MRNKSGLIGNVGRPTKDDVGLSNPWYASNCFECGWTSDLEPDDGAVQALVRHLVSDHDMSEKKSQQVAESIWTEA